MLKVSKVRLLAGVSAAMIVGAFWLSGSSYSTTQANRANLSTNCKSARATRARAIQYWNVRINIERKSAPPMDRVEGPLADNDANFRDWLVGQPAAVGCLNGNSPPMLGDERFLYVGMQSEVPPFLVIQPGMSRAIFPFF